MNYPQYSCSQCQKIFVDYKYKRRKFCCRECFVKSRIGLGKERSTNWKNGGGFWYTCKYCNRGFWASKRNRKFCSRKCFSKNPLIKRNYGEKHPQWKGGRKYFVCDNCQKKFKDYSSNRPNKHVFCSSECSAIYTARRGENHHFWKGGKFTENGVGWRKSRSYIDWRKNVFEKDCWKCVLCGSKSKINADHIKPAILFPELRYSLDNGRTLCFNCHKKQKTYGYKVTLMARKDFI